MIVDGQHTLVGDVSNGVSKLCAMVCGPKEKGLCLTILKFKFKFSESMVWDLF